MLQEQDPKNRERQSLAVRDLPAVHRVLGFAAVQDLCGSYGRDAVVVQARLALDRLRQRLLEECDDADQGPRITAETVEEILAADVAVLLQQRWGASARRVLNATGVFLHTNLGRAPLPAEVLRDLPGLLNAASDVELDLESGRRGDRSRRTARLLTGLTGAEDALVVNNTASALVLILASLTGGRPERREILVSRGELVEIGGSFRIPEILATAGAQLVEVGTTNRTRIDDYRRAVCERTAGILRVHPSNYRIRGFTERPGAADLASLAAEHSLPLVVDEGSGQLRPNDAPPLRDHESMEQLLDWGADLVCGSGDKVLGGPQAGIICGRSRHVVALRRHPLYRALRPSRMVLVTLEAVLRRHLRGAAMPLDRMFESVEELRLRLQPLAETFADSGARIEPCVGYVGGGSAPDEGVPGVALTLPADEALARHLRLGAFGATSVVGYLKDDRLWLDLRTVDPADDGVLAASLEQALAARRHESGEGSREGSS